MSLANDALNNLAQVWSFVFLRGREQGVFEEWIFSC